MGSALGGGAVDSQRHAVFRRSDLPPHPRLVAQKPGCGIVSSHPLDPVNLAVDKVGQPAGAVFGR